MNDSHCHFFSQRFFAGLGRSLSNPTPEVPETAALSRLGWDPPGTADELADRWLAELDRYDVARAALIASVPGDGDSVAQAVRRHPTRFVGFFMTDPTVPEAAVQVGTAIDHGGLRAICLFPALHGYSLDHHGVRLIFEVAAAKPGTAVFVHCGVLSIGARKKLGLPNSFDVGSDSRWTFSPLPDRFRLCPSSFPTLAPDSFERP
jgi:predicted TIM-barrel fold metal-dependent hydrolase